MDPFKTSFERDVALYGSLYERNKLLNGGVAERNKQWDHFSKLPSAPMNHPKVERPRRNKNIEDINHLPERLRTNVNPINTPQFYQLRDLLDGYSTQSVTLCVSGSPVTGTMLFKT